MFISVIIPEAVYGLSRESHSNSYREYVVPIVRVWKLLEGYRNWLENAAFWSFYRKIFLKPYYINAKYIR